MAEGDNFGIALIAFLLILFCGATLISMYVIPTTDAYKAGYEDYPNSTLYDRLEFKLFTSPFNEEYEYLMGYIQAKHDFETEQREINKSCINELMQERLERV